MSHRPTADKRAILDVSPCKSDTPSWLGSVRFARDGADRELPRFASHADTGSLPNLSGTAQCSQALPLHFCERFRRCQLGNPPVFETIVFSVGFGITPIGEQADDLEAIRRTAAYQDRRGHGLFSLFYTAQRRMVALHWRLFPRQSSNVWQISASAAVMAITKWSIPGSEKRPIAYHLPKPRASVQGIISVWKDRELGLPLE